jgi:hypothetical protein
LDWYEIYRTTTEADLNSKRKLQLISKFNKDGVVDASYTSLGSATRSNLYGDKYLNWSDATVIPGEDYYYRIVAMDVAGNTSEMSEFGSGRAYDLTPPTVPAWTAANSIGWTTVADGTRRASLNWILSEASLDVKIQRKKLGAAGWVTISTLHEASSFLDDKAKTSDSYEYRIQTSDRAGNKSPWSSVRTLPAE